MSTFTDLEKDAASVDGFVNENGLIETRRNGPKPSYQYLVDGWNAEIASTIIELNKSRGFRVVGTFADGFTYELFNDVGIDADGNSWIYVGAGAPNKVVAAGTVPSVGAGYEQVTFNTAENVQMTNGGSVQKFTTQNRQAIEALYKAQGYNNVFFFEDGFTYTESNDVGVYEDGTAWTYADTGALPVSITAGTVPNEGEYKAVKVVLPPFDTVADMESAAYLSTLPEGSRVEWLGYYAKSDGGSNWGVLKFGAHTEDGGSIFNIDATTYIEANLKGKSINARKFGAKGDLSQDDKPPIQAAIDYAIYSVVPRVIKRVKLTEGAFRLDSTLHLGYGEKFTSIELVGGGMGHTPRLEDNYGGTKLVSTFTDAPAINVQGNRKGAMRDLSVFGVAWEDFFALEIGGANTDGSLRYDETHYEYGDASTNAYSDTAPWCGLCFDGYAGAKPAIAYPDVDYPSYTNITSQYEKLTTSTFITSNVSIEGFGVAVVIQPSGADANGDFISFTSSSLKFNKYSLSICNSQARETNLINCILSNAYIHLTNNTHGAKKGNIGSIVGTGMERCAYLVDISTEFSGPVTINGYGEAVGGVGFVSSSASTSNSPVKFDSCKYSFAEMQGEQRGIPNQHVLADDNSNVEFSNCSLGVLRFFVATGGVSLTGGTQILNTANAITENSQRIAVRGTGSFLCNSTNSGIKIHDYSSRVFNLSSGNSELKSFNSIQRSNNVVRESFLGVNTDTLLQGEYQLLNTNVRSGETVSRYTAVVDADNMGAIITWDSNRKLIGVGDIARLVNSTGEAFYFVITSYVSGNDWIARRVSGYYFDGVEDVTYKSVGSVVGRFHTCTRLYSTKDPLFCNVTSGSATLTQCGNGANTFNSGIIEISVGDIIFMAGENNRVFDLPMEILAIDEPAKTITLDRTPSASVTGLHIPVLIRV